LFSFWIGDDCFEGVLNEEAILNVLKEGVQIKVIDINAFENKEKSLNNVLVSLSKVLILLNFTHI